MLCSRMGRATAAFSAMDRKLPRRTSLRVRVDKKPSTAFSQNADVGEVKPPARMPGKCPSHQPYLWILRLR